MSQEKEYTGGSVSYYSIDVNDPINESSDPYTAECEDIIEALKLTFQEGNVFKAIWRRAAARLGRSKKGYDDGLYDAEKIVFYGQRLVASEQRAKRSSAQVEAFVSDLAGNYKDGFGLPLTQEWRRVARGLDPDPAQTSKEAFDSLTTAIIADPKCREAIAEKFGINSEDPYGPRDAEGWYAWNGDETMRPAGKVDVVKRESGMWCGTAEEFIWNYGGSKSHADIVKWRPAQ